MKHRTVGCPSSAETVALNNSLKSSSLAPASDMNDVIHLEHILSEDLATHLDCLFALFAQAKFLEHSSRRNSGSFEMPLQRPIRLYLPPWLHESELDCTVTVLIQHFLLYNDTGSGLNDSDRDRISCLVKDLGHSNLFSNQTLNHDLLFLLGSKRLDFNINGGR